MRGKSYTVFQVVLTIVAVIVILNLAARLFGIPTLYSVIGSVVVTLVLFLMLWIFDRPEET
jgi:hypothetical protein